MILNGRGSDLDCLEGGISFPPLDMLSQYDTGSNIAHSKRGANVKYPPNDGTFSIRVLRLYTSNRSCCVPISFTRRCRRMRLRNDGRNDVTILSQKFLKQNQNDGPQSAQANTLYVLISLREGSKHGTAHYRLADNVLLQNLVLTINRGALQQTRTV